MFSWQNIRRDIRQDIENAESNECTAGRTFNLTFSRTFEKCLMFSWQNIQRHIRKAQGEECSAVRTFSRTIREHCKYTEYRRLTRTLETCSVSSVLLAEHLVKLSTGHFRWTESLMFCWANIQQDILAGHWKCSDCRTYSRTLGRTLEMHRDQSFKKCSTATSILDLQENAGQRVGGIRTLPP